MRLSDSTSNEFCEDKKSKMSKIFSPSNSVNSEPTQAALDSIGCDSANYDGIMSRCKGLLVQSLMKLHCEVHPQLTATGEALEYVESLILRLLMTLCATKPHSMQDVEERVLKTFPKPLDQWAIKEAQQTLERWQSQGTLRRSKLPAASLSHNTQSHGLTLPVDKVHHQVKELVGYKIEQTVSLVITAVLEYIARDILKLTGNYVKNIRHAEVTLQDCRVAMCADQVLDELFCFQGEDWASTSNEQALELNSSDLPEKNYASQVSELLYEERQHLKDVLLIIKVFRQTFIKPLNLSENEIQAIFGNIEDIYDFSTALLSSFEDVVEMTDEDQTPLLGSCFYDMAENYEFDVFDDYAHTITSPDCMDTLNEVLARPHVMQALSLSSPGFGLAARYVLPRLLWTPIFHCLYYFDAIRAMKLHAVNEEDRETLEQTDGLIGRLKTQLTQMCANVSNTKKKNHYDALFLRRKSAQRNSAISKINELSKCVDGWSSELQQREISQNCQEFVMEGPLQKMTVGSRRVTDRYAFLFDGVLILCKPTSGQSKNREKQADKESYRLKEKFFLRKVEVVDREDSDDIKLAFDLIPRDGGSNPAQQTTVLITKSHDDKVNWLSSLVALNTRSYLERSLDSILSNEEKENPLRLPENYIFSDADHSSNIIFEEKSSAGAPLIKGATLYKLVERLTYHTYADPSFVRTFLTTFRSFCRPKELLELLIERYDIPEPEDVDQPADQQMAKRLRKEYTQPVQVRVLNVIRHWVEHHFYDFERDQQLLVDLREFLEKRKQRGGKNMRKWIESITKAIQRKQEQQGTTKEHTFSHNPPPIEWFLVRDPEKFDLLTLHPVEIARQLTLLEFDLYRAVKPSELVNAAWTKKDKNITSPNLLKIIHHSSKFSFYLEKLIVECNNFEERVAVVTRCLEVMCVLQELNNFTGVFAVSSALSSAPVHRLEHTSASVKGPLRKALEDVLDLQSDHWRKYQERLRSINPPCVPFLGMYLTNILHIEEGNPDFITADGAELINFSKRRKVAEITGEIQQYQNQPYNLTTEREIRTFLESLSPQQACQSEKELNDYLYQQSLIIEPRGARQPPKFPRKWPDLTLKSPGIKTTRTHNNRSSSSSSDKERGGILTITGLSNNAVLHSYIPSVSSSTNASNSAMAQNQTTSGSNQMSSSGACQTATSPHPPHSPESENSSLLPSTPTSPPSSAGDTIHVPVLVPMHDHPTTNTCSTNIGGHPPPLPPSHGHPHYPPHAPTPGSVASGSPGAAERPHLPPLAISTQGSGTICNQVQQTSQAQHRRPTPGVFFPSSPSSPAPHQPIGHGPPSLATNNAVSVVCGAVPGGATATQKFSFPDVAPPLPPRIRRDDSSSPALPPRQSTISASPPPLPPRKAQVTLPQTQDGTPMLPPKTHKKPRPPPLVLNQHNPR